MVLKKKNFKVLGGSLVLSGITYQSTYLFVPGATINYYSEFFANFFPIVILGIMTVIAIFAIAQNLKRGENNNAQ